MRDTAVPGSPYIDPQLVPVLDLIPDIDLDDESLSDTRLALLRSRTHQPDQFAVTTQPRVAQVAGAAEVPVRIHAPTGTDTARAAVIQLHGGGLVMGSADIVDSENRKIVADLNCVVIAVDYRLAPEHCFPAALDDCYTVLAWVSANAAALGIDPGRIVVKGESAGGGLAACLSQLARDRGEYPIAFQHLTYPMLDDRTSRRSDLPPWAGALVWTRKSNSYGWHSYLGRPPSTADVSEYAVAARCADLSGLPPAYLVVGALDLFLEESAEYALRLSRAGVPVEFQIAPGAFHSFLSFGAATEVGVRFGQHSTDALRRACHAGQPQRDRVRSNTFRGSIQEEII
ncbi:alpha/beta hydrolase fold domain-containing protein [Nocardia sp. R6R-6]|uniref:alpha/beta hydrolase fold domain-containing protein n=1 Tax=Nocardia sp. R6R-6 TaxID=3459303 RepID=UPI00403D7933